MGETSRRLPKNLVGAPELTILALELLQPLALTRRKPGAMTLLSLHLSNPVPQGLRGTPDLGRNRRQRVEVDRLQVVISGQRL